MQIYSSFFCRVNEPSYIKHIKLDILTAVADETNAYDIATELTEYVNDIDEQLARAAVRAVGRISLEVSGHLFTSAAQAPVHGTLCRCDPDPMAWRAVVPGSASVDIVEQGWQDEARL